MRVALIDDEKIFLEKEQRLIKKAFLDEKEPCLLSVYYDGADFLQDYEEKKGFDLLILDVKMPGKNGLEVAEAVRKENQDIYIVLVTSYEQYAVSGYEYQVYGFVEKTNYERQLPVLCSRIIKQFKERYGKYYYIQSELKYEKFLMDQILYAERDGKYTIFYCQDNRIYKERASLMDVYNKLDKESFAYANRGVVINLKYVTYLTRGEVRLNGTVEFSVGRSCVESLREQMGRYWSRYV